MFDDSGIDEQMIERADARLIERVSVPDPEIEWQCEFAFSLTIQGRTEHLDKARSFYERMLRMVSHEPDVVLRLVSAIPSDAR